MNLQDGLSNNKDKKYVILILITYLNYKFVTQIDKFVTVCIKCSEIPPSSSVHYVARVLRKRVLVPVDLNLYFTQ